MTAKEARELVKKAKEHLKLEGRRSVASAIADLASIGCTSFAPVKYTLSKEDWEYFEELGYVVERPKVLRIDGRPDAVIPGIISWNE